MRNSGSHLKVELLHWNCCVGCCQPDRNQIVGRLVQIQDYIKQATSMMETLQKSGDSVSHCLRLFGIFQHLVIVEPYADWRLSKVHLYTKSSDKWFCVFYSERLAFGVIAFSCTWQGHSYEEVLGDTGSFPSCAVWDRESLYLTLVFHQQNDAAFNWADITPFCYEPASLPLLLWTCYCNCGEHINKTVFRNHSFDSGFWLPVFGCYWNLETFWVKHDCEGKFIVSIYM